MATTFNTYTKPQKKEELAEAKNGYYYQEDGIFLGKIGSSEDVYITDKATFDKIKNNQQVEDNKVIAFTKQYKLNNAQLLNRAKWIWGEGGANVTEKAKGSDYRISDYYAWTVKNLRNRVKTEDNLYDHMIIVNPAYKKYIKDKKNGIEEFLANKTFPLQMVNNITIAKRFIHLIKR